MTLKIGIAHAAWAEGREASADRLAAQILGKAEWFHSTEREHAREWAPRLWRWVAEQPDGTPCVLLNDDVILCPRFVEACEAIAKAHPGRFVSLHGQGPELLRVAQEGHRFARCYSYTGPGVMLYPEQARELLAFAEERPDLWTTQNEDGVANVWMWSKQEPALLSIPALVRHDTSVPSTLGYDGHAMRTSSVDWLEERIASFRPSYPAIGEVLANVEYWRKAFGPPPLIANPWMSDATMHALARSSPSDAPAGKASVMVATSTRGLCSPEYVVSLIKLVAHGERDAPWTIRDVAFGSGGIVHARSGLVRDFLESPATHLFFVDDDEKLEPVVLAGMLESGHDFVAAPYPRREGVDFVRANEAMAEGAPPEAAAYGWSWTPLNAASLEVVDDCVEVGGIGFGCVLLTRAACEKMVRHFGHDRHDGARFVKERAMAIVSTLLAQLKVGDLGDGGSVREIIENAMHEARTHQETELAYWDTYADKRTVALFANLFSPAPAAWGARLLGEDNSFCARWRAIGGRVMMYLGPGSPIDHRGTHLYKGVIEAFGLTRGGT